ncbi:conserved hypothetical protein [Hyphomicrobium sp. GJ21]|uniref:hypothetical protein n=1 Tax=Hyphomicrobium sp. GJ21 TaxID=113574 RepID=UPI000622BDC3|nr:hypothetical protein [Hyphomicrobium sp. GJ21]MBN9291190.1 hypothetical protein [Hyphomicrobium denitrificans]CEJ84355.1 conserved hypothetical protein [Hyphomicrobium sp. GJ21]
MPGLLRPEDLKMISSDAEMAEVDRDRQLANKKKQQDRALREAFMSRKVAPEAVERINNAVRIAAQNGHHHLEVITFPSSYCSDGGRRINIADAEWPTTLTGFAKDAYDFYDKELRPLGYKLRAEIINFPGGMPGDISLSIAW